MEDVLAQRAPAAEKEQRTIPRTKPLSSIPEPVGDGVTGAPVTELEYKHRLQCRT